MFVFCVLVENIVSFAIRADVSEIQLILTLNGYLWRHDKTVNILNCLYYHGYMWRHNRYYYFNGCDVIMFIMMPLPSNTIVTS